MHRFVVDASVVAKFLFAEDGSADAEAIVARAELIAPDLLVSEVANITWKKVRRGEVDQAMAAEARGVFATLPIDLVPTRQLFGRASGLAERLDHPAYDCFYLALAAVARLPFVTADERLRAAVERRGWTEAPVLSVRDAAVQIA